MGDTQTVNNDEIIEQNHERGPGWFLKISYIVIIASSISYWFLNHNWKSSYEEQQDKIHMQLQK